jgi:hypothetical protein
MSRKLCLLAFAAFSLCACGGPPTVHGGLTGNDTGGIIQWTPENQAAARDMAGAHCAHYGKYARITSVNARYGDYIGFVCVFRG